MQNYAQEYRMDSKETNAKEAELPLRDANYNIRTEEESSMTLVITGSFVEDERVLSEYFSNTYARVTKISVEPVARYLQEYNKTINVTFESARDAKKAREDMISDKQKFASVMRTVDPKKWDPSVLASKTMVYWETPPDAIHNVRSRIRQKSRREPETVAATTGVLTSWYEYDDDNCNERDVKDDKTISIESIETKDVSSSNSSTSSPKRDGLSPSSGDYVPVSLNPYHPQHQHQHHNHHAQSHHGEYYTPDVQYSSWVDANGTPMHSQFYHASPFSAQMYWATPMHYDASGYSSPPTSSLGYGAYQFGNCAHQPEYCDERKGYLPFSSVIRPPSSPPSPPVRTRPFASQRSNGKRESRSGSRGRPSSSAPSSKRGSPVRSNDNGVSSSSHYELDDAYMRNIEARLLNLEKEWAELRERCNINSSSSTNNATKTRCKLNIGGVKLGTAKTSSTYVNDRSTPRIDEEENEMEEEEEEGSFITSARSSRGTRKKEGRYKRTLYVQNIPKEGLDEKAFVQDILSLEPHSTTTTTTTTENGDSDGTWSTRRKVVPKKVSFKTSKTDDQQGKYYAFALYESHDDAHAIIDKIYVDKPVYNGFEVSCNWANDGKRRTINIKRDGKTAL